MIFAYFFAIFLIFFIKSKLKFITKALPNLKMTKSGITFYSTNRHKIFVGEVKILEIGGIVYLKNNKKMVVFINICDYFIKEDYFYFKSLGEVKIIFKCKSIFSFFNIKITSNQFDFKALKQQALNQVVNNLFNLENCNLVKRYISAIKNILNIDITEKSITVKPNKYLLKFSLTYRVKNVIKTVNFN